jgi:lipid-binding SYLF domain-containing protein
LDGAVVAVRDGLNEAYYGKKVTPSDIFVRQNVKNLEAIKLIEAVKKGATEKPAGTD